MSLDEMFRAASGKPLSARTMFERHFDEDDDYANEQHQITATRLPWWGAIAAIAAILLLSWALGGPEWAQFMHRMDELGQLAAWWVSDWKT